MATALASIFCQNYVGFEVIVIDGKSSDGTQTVVQTFSASNPNLSWISEKDAGVYEAMNKGVLKAKGEWLFFLGSDDSFFDCNVLAEVYQFIQQKKDARLIYGDVSLNKPIGYNSTEMTYGGQFDEERLLKKNICHQSIFYHRSLFENFGLYRTRYKIFADYDFNLRCFNITRSYYLKRIIANFNVGGQSNIHQNLDGLFVDSFLLNMAVYYPYNFKHAFFNGRKKELLSLLTQNLRSFRLKNCFKIARILTYQLLKSNNNKIINNPTHQTI